MNNENEETKIKAPEGVSDETTNLPRVTDADTQTQSIPRPEGGLHVRDSDTSKLKRIQPKANVGAAMDADNNTDTVHLKVIKEKKKQLAGILTASQTIRLRPPSGNESAPAPASAGTLKVSVPQVSTPPASAGTLKVSVPPAQAPASSAGTLKVEMPMQSAPQAGGTLKINMPVSSTESGTIKVTKAQVAESAAAGTLKIKAPSASDSSVTPPAAGTLKIKAPTASATATPPAASGTLKIKAPSAEAEETVRMDSGADDKKGGTLKLKTGSGSMTAPAAQGGPVAGTQRSAARAQEEVAEVDPRTLPGIFTILGSFIAISAAGFLVYIATLSYFNMYMSKSSVAQSAAPAKAEPAAPAKT
ncbi:MAG: hypothetical protein RL095_1084 [Verrucomicrobiota bacterium]|jgi:hypothetical protein